MTHPEAVPKRSLQARLTIFYAAGVYAAGIAVLVIVDLPLAEINSTRPAGQGVTVSTSSGQGMAPHQLLAGSALALVVLIPVALALGWFIAGRFLQPLRTIAATAKAISAGNLDERLDLGEPTDELTNLGRTLDDLFARLEAAFDAQRHFVANASHELRTPLAGLRTLLEVALADPDADADTLRSVCHEALALGQHQERLVHALLALATGQRGATRWDMCDLAELAHRVLAARREEATARGIHLVETLAPAVIRGDPRLIESLIANLIDNAIQHNHPDGYLEITTETAGPRVTLTVANSGPVIAADQVQRLLEPFQRLSPDRHAGHHGYGLGLAIVNSITRAHQATLTTWARTEGGLDVTVGFHEPVDARMPISRPQ